MTSEQFVDALREVAIARAVDSALSAIEKPAGRQPAPDLVEASSWYARLSDEDRRQLRNLASMVAHHAVFGVLTVLDGSRVIENTADKGNFKLIFRKGSIETELNSPNGVPLHDLLNRAAK